MGSNFEEKGVGIGEQKRAAATVRAAQRAGTASEQVKGNEGAKRGRA